MYDTGERLCVCVCVRAQVNLSVVIVFCCGHHPIVNLCINGIIIQ